MRASVIILNWNGVDLLKPCLAAIEAHTQHDDYEVIVLDNGSVQPGVDDAVRPYSKVRLIKEPVNHGFSRGNNIAARQARGEYLIILNNDTLPRPGWLTPLLEAVGEGVGIAGARLVDGEDRVLYAGGYFDPSINAYVPAFRHYPADSAREPRECETYIACGIALRRDLYESVGGFDEHYFQGYEDIDLCLRVRERGLKVMYCPESVIEHVEHASMDRMETRERRRSKERNREYFESRWRDRIHEFRLESLPAGLEDFDIREHIDEAMVRAVPGNATQVLHLECGTGRLGERLKQAHPSMQVTGLEADAEAARLAKARLDEVVHGGSESMRLQAWKGRFDLVLFSGLMEKARDPWQLLFRLHDCLVPGGLLVGRFHNIAHYKLVRRLAREDWRYEPGGPLDHANLRFFSRGSLEDLLTYAGFELLSTQSLGAVQPMWRAAASLSARARELSTAAYLVTAKARPRRAS